MTATDMLHNTPTFVDEGQTEPLDVGGPERASRSASDERLRTARTTITQPGCYLIHEGVDGEPVISTVEGKTIRVGRSLHADIRFEDPSVSRRHALIIRHGDELRVVDDRSLNGVFLGGEQVSSSILADGDELTVGRHLILFVRLPVV